MTTPTPLPAKPLTKPLFVRDCPLWWRPENIPAEIGKLIENHYRNGMQLLLIMKCVNGRIHKHRSATVNPLSVLDLYAYLYSRQAEGRKPGTLIPEAQRTFQRKEHLEIEMQLDHFHRFFHSWREGMDDEDLLELRTIKASAKVRKSVLAAIKTRVRTAGLATKAIDNDKFDEIMSHAQLTVIDGRPAYVIFASDIPPDILMRHRVPRHRPDGSPESTANDPLLSGLDPTRTDITLTLPHTTPGHFPLESDLQLDGPVKFDEDDQPESPYQFDPEEVESDAMPDTETLTPSSQDEDDEVPDPGKFEDIFGD